MSRYPDGIFVKSRNSRKTYEKDTLGGTTIASLPQPRIEYCRRNYCIILRIVKGQPTCIRKGGEIVHQGIGCAACPKSVG
ncbi:MAG: hypothetical protein V1854_04880 [Methanobacteriota archaeon]